MRFYDNLLGHTINEPHLQLNNRGHRCKDIEDIDLRNYLLFAGDNVGLDFNLPMEETYPYLVSRELNLDYYNLSIFNGGIDATKYNLITWFTQTKYQPKALIVSFEFINAIMICDGTFENFNNANYNDEKVKQISDVGDISGFFPTRQLLANKILKRIIPIPIIQVEFENRTALFQGEKIYNLVHDGELSDHTSIANLITPVYNNKIKRQMP